MHHKSEEEKAAEKKAKEEHAEKVAEELLGFLNAKEVIDAPGRPSEPPLGGPVDEDRSA
jgi:hypothetical protein